MLGQRSILDRDRRVSGQQADHLFIFGAERLCINAIGQIQPAQLFAFGHDRHAQKARHFWMAGAEAHRSLIVLHRFHADRFAFYQQCAEQP